MEAIEDWIRGHDGITGTRLERLARVEESLAVMEKTLFGNGNPGVIDNIQKTIESLQRWKWITFGVILAFQFLTGSGIISLKSLVGH